MSLPSLLTSRLILRPLNAGDAEAIVALAGNWHVASQTRRIPHPYTLEAAQEFIAAQKKAQFKGEEWIWGVCLKDEGHPLIGCVGVTFGDMEAELGYWLGETYWKQGFATEAARAVVNYAFERCELWQIDGKHLFNNHESGRVLTKLGFQVVGFSRGACREENQDIVHYRLLRAAWIARPDRETFA